MYLARDQCRRELRHRLARPYRIKQNVAVDVFCSDGITPFELPGGSNCP
jgi:hypothetical protein